VATIHVAGVRCDPCGAMQGIAPQGSQGNTPTVVDGKNT